MDGAEDQPDGLLQGLFHGVRHRSGDSKGADSAYNSHDSEEDTQPGKTEKSKKSKKNLRKKTIDAPSVQMNGLQLSCTAVLPQDSPPIPPIMNEPIKIKAMNCTSASHCDGLLTSEDMVTAFPVYPLTFCGCLDDKYSTQLWIPKLWHDRTQPKNSLLQIGMLDPSCSGKTPESEMDEDNTEVTRVDCGPPKIEREPDTGITQSKVDPKLYPYRLARVKQNGGIILAAVHVDDAEDNKDIFGIDWKLTVYQDHLTLQDTTNPKDGKSSSNDLYLAGTNSKRNPFLVKRKNHWDFLQNPMVRLSIFSVSDD